MGKYPHCKLSSSGASPRDFRYAVNLKACEKQAFFVSRKTYHQLKTTNQFSAFNTANNMALTESLANATPTERLLSCCKYT